MASLRMTSAPPCVTAAFVLRVTGFWRPLCYVLRAVLGGLACVTVLRTGLLCYSKRHNQVQRGQKFSASGGSLGSLLLGCSGGGLLSLPSFTPCIETCKPGNVSSGRCCGSHGLSLPVTLIIIGLNGVSAPPEVAMCASSTVSLVCAKLTSLLRW